MHIISYEEGMKKSRSRPSLIVAVEYDWSQV